jgi:hypothetical protein
MQETFIRREPKIKRRGQGSRAFLQSPYNTDGLVLDFCTCATEQPLGDRGHEYGLCVRRVFPRNQESTKTSACR